MQSRHFNILLPSAAALCLASCASENLNDYDTSAAYGTADYGQADTTTPYQPVNPVYDTPAAYEEPSAPAVTTPAPAPVPRPTSKPAATTTVHTVGKGDTLWGLSKKYNVTVDAIKRANGMTKDTVVLGSKLQIPAR